MAAEATFARDHSDSSAAQRFARAHAPKDARLCSVIRYAVIRLLWAIPTLGLMCLLVFAAATFLVDDSSGQREAMRREHFVDLPRFYNSDPQDLQARVDAAIALLDVDSNERAIYVTGNAEFARLGGAALPLILPKFSYLSPSTRARVAMALAPIAQRMGRFSPSEYDTPERAITFWTQFWDAHSIDFTPASRRRAIERYVAHGGPDRAREVALLDTYALPLVLPMLETTTRRDALQRLIAAAAQATSSKRTMPDGATQDEADALVAQWQSYWFVYGNDFELREGPERVIDKVACTRYGRWTIGTITGHLASVDGQRVSITRHLLRRLFITLLLIATGLLLALGASVPLGVLSAYRAGSAVDRTIAGCTFLIYAVPAFVLSQLLAAITTGPLRTLAAATVLAAALTASLTRAQRAAMQDALASDFVRTARAKGVAELRVVVVHAMRNALMPLIALVTAQLPALIGSSLVVESVFGLPGIGAETMRALAARDVAWLVFAVLVFATLTTLALVAADVAYVLIDPRLKQALRRSRWT
jgi:peptide/nickel transport system permease protein